MKCCNGNCNQGRWCQVRQELAQQRIDKIKKILYTVTTNYNIAEIIAIGFICLFLRA